MSSMYPKVSITVTTYQHGGFIEACLQSLVDQDYNEPYEILVGEDGSSDGTRDICKRFAKQYPEKIRLFLNDDKSRKIFIGGNPTGRRNILDLIKEAKGTYIANCEGDDLWLSKDKLRKQVELMDQNPNAAGAFHDSVVIDEKGNELHRFRNDLPERMSASELIRPLAPFHFSSFMFRKEFDPTSRAFYKQVASFDFLLFVDVAANGELLKVPNVLSAYRKHGGGVTEGSHHKHSGFHLYRMWLWASLLGRSSFKRKELHDIICVHASEISNISRGKKENVRILRDFLRTAKVNYVADFQLIMRLVKGLL